jgi:hypothetical protein
MHRSLLLLVFVCFTTSAALAQDPVKVDPQHYKVIFENEQVRVLHIHYGPHEKSVMHSHPDAVVVFESDAHMKMTDARRQVGRIERHGPRFAMDSRRSSPA